MTATSAQSKSCLREAIFSRYFYAELYVLIITFLVAGYVFSHVVYYTFAGFSVFVYLIVVILQKKWQHISIYLDTLVTICLASGVGLLQFNPIPIACLLVFILLLVIRHNKHRAVILFLLALLVVSISWGVSFVILAIRPNLSPWVDYACLAVTFIIFASKYMGLQQYLFKQQQQLNKHSGRIHRLVTVTNRLARYLPIQVWQPIISGRRKVIVHNHRAKLSILFADIAGFTELSDELTSDSLSEILNTYIEQMTIIAKKHNATLDKFIGDGMLCFFGDPSSAGEKEDAIACVKMAIDMRREMRLLRQKWKLLGFKGLYVRIGIATGYSHVGNFGSPFRMNYTVIGREVNLAARLQAVAKPGQIFISDTTYHYVRHQFPCKMAGSLRLKGFSEPVTAWQVLEADDGLASKWIEHDLPGFNLHLSLQDIHDYDKKAIKNMLQDAVHRMEE